MKNIMNSISFTKNEAKAILFIVSVLVTGLSIKYYKHIISSSSEVSFDFSQSDKEFNERSGNTNSLSTLTEEEPTDNSISGNQKKLSEFTGEKVNLNTASKEEIVELPGIGESTAEKIISYREEKKGFKKIEDLMNVKGIGKKKFEKLKQFVKIN